ncbi:MAG: hypothetical protein EU536_01400 [Promethearchaeota archaeon]|nr:MAG: hypothetical protein EU536_01400 [Candidatus Lokiarchaeota archaeon]
MLTGRQRIRVLILCMIFVFAVPALINQLAIVLNLDINPTDINLYQNANTVEYLYENGSLGHSSRLTLDINVPETKDITTVTATLDSVEITFQVNYTTGHWIDNGVSTSNFTIFWILVQNPMLHGWEFALFENTSIVDPVGLLGPVNATYTLIIGEKKVYWDVYPGMDGAQFSFVINIYDASNVKVGDGLMDSTCGFLEILQGGPNNARIEVISPGNFQVSRNRYMMLWWGLVFTIALPITCFLLMRWRGSDKEVAEEFALLLAVGTSATFIDITIDVWFYARLGYTGMIILHFAAVIGYALVCIRLKYGVKWVIPAFLEVAFIFSITQFVGDPYVPHITAFLGLIVTYLAMLFRSGIDKKKYDGKLDFII